MTDSMYRGRRRFTQEQARFVAEVIIAGAVDIIHSCIETRLTEGLLVVPADLQAKRPDEIPELDGYEEGVLSSCGMALSIFYAQVTREGLGAGDALVVADKIDEQVKRYKVKVAHNPEYYKRFWSIPGQSWTNAEGYPDVKAAAAEFVKGWRYDWASDLDPKRN